MQEKSKKRLEFQNGWVGRFHELFDGLFSAFLLNDKQDKYLKQSVTWSHTHFAQADLWEMA